MWDKNGCHDSRCRSSHATSKLFSGSNPHQKTQKEKEGKVASFPLSFYQNEDVITLSRRLLGCNLFTCKNGIVTGGKIVESEAYRGIDDRACHAFGNRKTKRTEAMYLSGGVAYVYLCYGIHHLFNVVTNREGTPHAILVRALEPTHGIEEMLRRRKMDKVERKLTAGPAMLTQALDINLKDNKTWLNSSSIWIEDRKEKPGEILASPRVGVTYAKEDALLPYRFRIKDSKWTSLAN